MFTAPATFSSQTIFCPWNQPLKRSLYRVSYRDQGFAFAPIVSNSLGQVGPDFLLSLWGLAEHAARNSEHVALDDLPHLDPAMARTLPAQIFNACLVTSASRPRTRFSQGSLKVLLNECMVAFTRSCPRPPGPSFTSAMGSTRWRA